MDEHLRVAGETQVFALGDLADADRDMAGIATAQAGVVATNIRALITGTGELTSWDTFPPLIAIPLGPEGGAGFIGDGVADSATIAELKGRHMIIDNYAVALRRRAGRGWLRLARRLRSGDPGGRSPCSWMGSNTHGGGRSAVAS